MAFGLLGAVVGPIGLEALGVENKLILIAVFLLALGPAMVRAHTVKCPVCDETFFVGGGGFTKYWSRECQSCRSSLGASTNENGSR